MFLTSTLILLKFRNYIYYTLSVLFTFLTTIIFFLAFVKFNNNIQEVILIWFLIILSTITFIGWTQSIYHLIKNRYNEPDYGPTGDQGDKGLTGRTANTSISEYDLCVQQMNDITNKNILKKLKKTETQDNLFNNLFVKDNYKRICSKYFK
tara:strand:+ start:100 stop:552 length:453 start_codon:yes stop_codon:yes gene_type:complete